MKILIGNKSDLTRTVSESKIQQFLEKHNLEYYELSCVFEKKFTEVFERIIDSIVKLIPVLPKPEQLMKKNIIIGKKLLQSTKYQLVL